MEATSDLWCSLRPWGALYPPESKKPEALSPRQPVVFPQLALPHQGGGSSLRRGLAVVETAPNARTPRPASQPALGGQGSSPGLAAVLRAETLPSSSVSEARTALAEGPAAFLGDFWPRSWATGFPEAARAVGFPVWLAFLVFAYGERGNRHRGMAQRPKARTTPAPGSTTSQPREVGHTASCPARWSCTGQLPSQRGGCVCVCMVGGQRSLRCGSQDPAGLLSSEQLSAVTLPRLRISAYFC